MGRPIGPKKVHRYSIEFKLTAVKLSHMPGVQVQTLAEALNIHPISRALKKPSGSLPHESGDLPGHRNPARSVLDPAHASTPLSVRAESVYFIEAGSDSHRDLKSSPRSARSERCTGGGNAPTDPENFSGEVVRVPYTTENFGYRAHQ